MNWQIYKLRYKVKSPLHIGYHKLGFVQRTRYFVPGRTMWGAGAEYLARSLGNIDDKVYSEARKFFLESAVFSYFYLEHNGNLYLPRYEQRLKMGGLSLEEFEAKFISSFGKTAVEPHTTTAEDGTLHEIEYIQPLANLHLVGYLFLRNDAEFNKKRVVWEDKANSLKSVLQDITIGGERRYGFGRINLVEDKKEEIINNKVNLFNKEINIQEIERNGKTNLQFTISQDTPLFSHLEAINTGDLKIKGDIEPIVGREYKIKDDRDEKVGFGQKITEAQIGWEPGSIVGQEYSFILNLWGILKISESVK
ncbi:MAG: hypothetical protein N2748_03865 [candidate division WOR-3 bacterium]|nr:hypothetical protein [candidate division WOR-3 bacterium]